MSPAAFAAKRDAVNDATISIMASGSVGVVTCKRYATPKPTLAWSQKAWIAQCYIA